MSVSIKIEISSAMSESIWERMRVSIKIEIPSAMSESIRKGVIVFPKI
jgi:hypothetical protein